MWSKTFALAVLERAIKTFAQSAAALLTASGIGLLDADWLQIVSVSGMAAVVSVLTSVGTGAVSDGSPSIGSVETVTEWPIYDPQHAIVPVDPDAVDYDVPDGADPGDQVPLGDLLDDLDYDAR